jgi:hypothetical protein
MLWIQKKTLKNIQPKMMILASAFVNVMQLLITQFIFLQNNPISVQRLFSSLKLHDKLQES